MKGFPPQEVSFGTTMETAKFAAKSAYEKSCPTQIRQRLSKA
jgi:hypothetical protein